MKLKTTFVNPPIPIRNCDWCCYDEDTYDGPGCLVGYGPTEEAAIAEFKDLWEAHYNEDFPDEPGEKGNL